MRPSSPSITLTQDKVNLDETQQASAPRPGAAGAKR